jgi:hypothetical protein
MNNSVFLKLNGTLHDRFCECSNRLPYFGLPDELGVDEHVYLQLCCRLSNPLSSAMWNVMGKLIPCSRRVVEGK